MTFFIAIAINIFVQSNFIDLFKINCFYLFIHQLILNWAMNDSIFLISLFISNLIDFIKVDLVKFARIGLIRAI
jgi:hypothetical protein